MKLIKDCTSRFKGRCKKAGHYCCGHPEALLSTCPLPKDFESKVSEKRGKKKK